MSITDSNGNPSGDTLCSTLRATAESLTDLTLSSEAEFLSMFDRLVETRSSADLVVSSAEKALLAIREEAVDAALERLAAVVDGTCVHLREASETAVQDLGLLDDSITQLEEFERPLFLFSGTTKQLSILATHLRLEGARISAGSSAFTALADSVDDLCTDSAAAAMVVTSQQEAVLMQARKARRVLAHLDEVSSSRSSELVAAARASGVQLSCLRDACAQAISELQKRCVLLKEHTWRAVSALQGQDIMRQRIEHVCATLLELCSAIESQTCEQADADRIMRLQAAQLDEVAEMVRDSMSAARQAITSIDQIAEELVRTALEAMHVTDSFGSKSIEEVEAAARGAEQMMNEFIDDAMEVNRNAQEVVRAIGAMGQRLAFMEASTREVRRVAMNTVLLAHTAGSEGVVLAVIADLVKLVAAESAQGTATVMRGIRSLDSVSERLEAGSTMYGTHAEKAHYAKEQMHAALQTLESSAERSVTCLKEVQSLSRAIHRQAVDVSMRGDVDARFRYEIAHASSRLTSAANHLGESLDEGTGDLLAAVVHRYSTHDERVIHSALTGELSSGGPEFAPGELELL